MEAEPTPEPEDAGVPTPLTPALELALDVPTGAGDAADTGPREHGMAEPHDAEVPVPLDPTANPEVGSALERALLFS